MLMKRLLLFIALLPVTIGVGAQSLEVGMEMTTGPAYTSFRGDLAGIVGFSELEITEAQVDTALANINVSAPRWLKELFPGTRIAVDQEVRRSQTRSIPTVRFFARYKFFGGSFSVSAPRLTEPQESKKLKNQIKAVRLSLAGKAAELSEHLAEVALADVDRVSPFFENRYDLEAYVHFKKLLFGEDPLLEWGSRGNSYLDIEVTSGVRFTADPSPVVDLGSVLFISQRLDSLMEGGILAPVESTTDAIAESVQAVVFGKFKDPRIVPSMGWFLRTSAPVNLGGAFSVLLGAELSLQKPLSVNGAKPIFSMYGFAGVRWSIIGEKRKR